jgi:hypothetical protein
MAEAAPVTVPVERPTRGRSITAAICIILAAVLTVPSALAYWGQRTINDGTRYVATVGPLVDSPEVQTAIATKVTDAIQQQVDVEALLTQAFSGVTKDRPKLQLLIGPFAGAVNGLIQTQVQNFVASDQFRALWIELNTRAQERLEQLLKGDDSGAVQVQGGEVVLDLSVVVDKVKSLLVARGLTFVQNAPPIPAADQQIVLLQSDQLKQVRTIYAFSNPVAKWLLPLVALLYLVALLVSRRRPRMTIIIGAALAANGILVAIALSIGRQLFVNQLSGTVFGPASRVFYDQLLTYLERGQKVMLWLGILLILVGIFSGGTRFGIAVRSTTTRFLESVGAPLATTGVVGTGRWVAVNALWLRIVAGVLGLVVLLWGNEVSVTRLFWSAVLVGILLAAIQVLVGTGRAAESGTPADDGPAPDEPQDTLPLPAKGSQA